jgi:hypothetical protein
MPSGTQKLKPLTKRILSDHGHFSYRELPAQSGQAIAVRDQLLVSQSALTDTEQVLANAGVEATVLTTMLDGISNVPPGIEDVTILEISHPSHGQDVFDLVSQVRDELGPGSEQDITPNHVCIAAPVEDECPYGPPQQAPAAGAANPHGPAHAAVTVIDSGYQWLQSWGTNPLDAMCDIQLVPGNHPEVNGWFPDDPDEPDKNINGLLDTLAGHANFVAGIIAQRCDQPVITVRNHNGAFAVGPGKSIPTEAAVCRSMIEAVSAGQCAVIHVGYAFATLDDHVSKVWNIPFDQGFVGAGCPVVAPAGNHGTPGRRYPAALNDMYPGQFPTVFGVGSLQASPPHNPSSFSNSGSWVRCSAVGEKVLSTFLDVNLPPEDPPVPPLVPPPITHNYASNCWAIWQGTSFSAPKVAAALVAQSWAALTAGVTQDPSYGFLLPNL